MPHRWIVRLACLCATAASLAQAQAEIRHPNADNLRDPPNTRVLSRAGSTTTSAELQGLARRLRMLKPEPVKGPEYGRIVDVVVRNGRVAVADQGFYAVTVLDTVAWEPSTFGQQGSGPLDFRTLVAVEFSAPHRLSVFDAALGQKTLAIEDPATPRLLAVVPPRVPVRSACLRPARPIVLAPSGLMPGASVAGAVVEPLLMELDSTGAPARRFGESYRSESPLTRRVMSEAVMGCTGGGDVVVGYVSLPYLRVYGADGALRHTIRLRDYTQGWTVERRDANGRASIGLAPETREFSQARRVVEVAAGIVAVQVATLRVERRSIVTARLDTYLVAARGGEGVYVGDHLPYLAAADGIPSVGFRDDPEPALLRLVPR